MKKIALTKGKVSFIDDEDVMKVMAYNWNYNGRYALTKINRKTIYLHRFIMNAPETKVVDHINGNRLDNRKRNLRLVTQAQNLWNKIKSSKNTSGYKGVFWNKDYQKWQAEIKINGKRHYLGKFTTPEQGAIAYNEAAKRYQGEFIKLDKLKM